jgi:hypothetical protein
MTLEWNDADIPGELAGVSDSLFTATPPGVGAVPITGPCTLDESDEVKLASPSSAPTVMRLVRVHVQTSLFGFAVGGTACSVDGVAYEVWEPLKQANGLTQLLLRVV